MAQFIDSAGTSWPLSVTVGTVRRVKQALDIDLLAIADGDQRTGSKSDRLLARLFTDPMLLADVLYVVCQETCAERQVTDEQFGGLLGGDAIAEATDALLEALVDFFPPAKREALRKILGRIREVEDRAAQRASALMGSEKMLGRIDREIDEAIAKIEREWEAGDSSGTAPAS